MGLPTFFASKPFILLNLCIITVTIPLIVYFHRKGRTIDFYTTKLDYNYFLKKNAQEIKKHITDGKKIFVKRASPRKAMPVAGILFIQVQKNNASQIHIYFSEKGANQHNVQSYETLKNTVGRSRNVCLINFVEWVNKQKFGKILFDKNTVHYFYYDDKDLQKINEEGSYEGTKALLNLKC